MKEEKLAKIFYSDLWGLREEKYDCLLKNDVKTIKWQELGPVAPYYFFVPKDFALQEQYEKFWKVTDIFTKWSSGVKTHRDHFIVGFTEEEIRQRMRVFTGDLPDELVKQGLNLRDTGSWAIKTARESVKGTDWMKCIRSYSYRPFDNRHICYLPDLVDRGRWDFMRNFFEDNLGITTIRSESKYADFSHVFLSSFATDIHYSGGQTYVFPLYLYGDKSEQQLLGREASKAERICNLTPEFSQAIKESLGLEATPQEIFHYIYSVLYSPTYRKRYEEFLKIDFPRIPLPSDYEVFKELSDLGKELVDLHLLKSSHLGETGIGVSQSGSNVVEKVSYDEDNQRVFINKERYFEGISKGVWEYRIGAYQVMEKYLKDRRKRKLSLDEINHYMKVAKAIQLTMELQEKIDVFYGKMEEQEALLRVKGK